MGLRTEKFRLYPSGLQEERLEECLGSCCFVYNELLGAKYDRGFSRLDLQNETLRDLKAANPSLKKVHSQVLQMLTWKVDESFESYKKRYNKGVRPAGKPRFKSKTSFESMTYPQSGFKIENNRLILSKIGSIPLKQHRELKGNVKTLTIKKEKSGKWFACFTVEINEEKKVHPHANKGIGLDVGITSLVATSEGELFENPRWMKKSEKKLKRAQRKLSKKKKGSNNRKRAKKKVATVYEKLVNQRNDYLHKISRKLVNKNEIIVVEDLNIKPMMKNHRLAKSIGDASWNTLIRMLAYKAESAGGQLVKVDACGTSQTCLCGASVPKTLGDRIHACPICGIVEPRDTHSAKMILDRYRRNCGNLSLSEHLIRDAMTQDAQPFRAG